MLTRLIERIRSLALVVAILSAACVIAEAQESPPPDAQTLPATTEPSAAEEAPPPAEAAAEPMFDLTTTKTLTGDWGGVRTDLADAGIAFDIKLMNEWMLNMRGGLETKNGNDFGGSYEINLEFDFEKMGWINGASLFFQAEGDWGGEISDFDREKIGALSRTNYDAGEEEVIYIDKWWWKQQLWDGKLELRAGRLQMHKDLFDRSWIMGDEDTMFLNQALTVNRTFLTAKGLGLYARWNVTDTVFLHAAAIDAQARDRQTNFNTAFHDECLFRAYGELGWAPKWASSRGDLKGSYRIGTWFDPTVKTRNDDPLPPGSRLSPKTDNNDWGFYVGLDQMIWRESSEDEQGLSLGGRYGWSDGNVNRVEHFWALAAQYKGLIDGRDKDVLGLGMAQSILADELRQSNPFADRETVYELYYSIEVFPWLFITPDFQFIANAGGNKNSDNAAIFGLRVRMKL